MNILCKAVIIATFMLSMYLLGNLVGKALANYKNRKEQESNHE